jgi:hypothetical protein
VIKGLVTHYIRFFIDIASRAVKIAGITAHPDSRWMTQIARNLTDLEDGFLRSKRYLILDRDTKYSDAFRSVLVRETALTAPRSLYELVGCRFSSLRRTSGYSGPISRRTSGVRKTVPAILLRASSTSDSEIARTFSADIDMVSTLL